MVPSVGKKFVIAVGATLASFALAPGAQAGSPLPTDHLGSSGLIEYLRTKFPNVVSQAGPATACPLDTELTGGGASISGSAKDGHLNSSGPVTSAESWEAEGRSSASGGATVTSWAICGPADMTRVSSTENVSENVAQFNSSLSCPSGELPVSPGISETEGDIQLLGLFPGSAPNSWLLSAANASASPGVAKYWALCSGGYPVRFREASREIKEKETGKVIAKCKGREALIGGGVKVVRQSVWQESVPALAVRPWDSKDDAGKTPDDGYYAKTYNGTRKTVTQTAYAVCTPLTPV
jgi:hypothetical protein